MRRRMWASLTSVPLACLAAWAQAPAQRPAFRTGVQLVRLDVSVLDGRRQPVRGLLASDFTVLEDGQPRPVRAFEAVDHTATPAAATASIEATTGVSTNQASKDTSRLIFILMDRSIPPERPMIVARQIADAAVDAMAPGDQAAVVTTGTGVPQNLTSDRARLHKTIAGSDWSQAPSQGQQDQGAGKYDPLTDGACLCGLCVMDTIARIANEVRDVPRRKLLLFIGSNLVVQAGPRPMAADVGCDQRVRESRERLFDALGASALTVHSIDPQGLASVGPAARATVANGVENRDGRALNGQLAQERMEFMAAQGNLDVLPALTGGRTIVNSNDPFRMVPEVLRESDAYYLIAFEPIESTGDVRHRVEVKVARKGVQVHSARFIEPSAARAPAVSGSNAPLERALTDLLPDAALPLRMAVSTFAGPDRHHAYVGITIDASSLAAGAGSVPLEIAVQASDERGRRVAAARQNGRIEVPPSPGNLAALVELQTYLTLPPGDYELRSAVANPSTMAAASVFTHVTVPTFDDAAVTLSDVVLGTRENAGLLPEGAPPLPIVPTTVRVFNAAQPAWAFVRAYRAVDTDGSRPPAVSIETTVLDAGGKRVKHQSLPDASFAGRTADVRLPLPLRGLADGHYLLRIEARQGRRQEARTVAFDVTAAPAPLTQEHSPDLDAALAAAAKYVDGYEHRISAVGAEEAYEQATQRPTGGVARGDLFSRAAINRGAPTATLTRKTRANVMTISLGERGWVSFRDVFEMDGQPVRDRVERLSRILQTVDPQSLEQARQIADESARYNLDPEGVRLDRTINVPMTALHFLRAANQPRSVFRLGKPERIAGVDCVTLQFVEQGLPRLIRTSDEAAAQGTFWIDMAGGGRVLKTELRLQSAGAAGQSVRSQITVTYGRVSRLELWVPVAMDETYYLAATGQVVDGHAIYSDFREFKVTTAEGIK